MRILAAAAGLGLLAVVLWDSFETIILPRRVTREFRITRAYFRVTWTIWAWVARRLPTSRFRQSYLSYYGPLSLLMLFAVWVAVLIVSFGLLQWAGGSAVSVPGGSPSFQSDLYLSGTTFFTLGIGDVTPLSGLAKLVTVVEAGTGFGLLAIVISYLPVLYGAFSRRETRISLMDARAGSPPSAGVLLRRYASVDRSPELIEHLHEWEEWSAELMESHLSYPILCYFRSQHTNQSWIAALAAVLDACAFLMAYGRENLRWQARLTFAIARHALVDLAVVVTAPPREPEADRLPPAVRDRLRESLVPAGMALLGGAEGNHLFSKLRTAYEPYLAALSHRFMMPLPAWVPDLSVPDNWQRSAWDASGGGGKQRTAGRSRALEIDDGE